MFRKEVLESLAALVSSGGGVASEAKQDIGNAFLATIAAAAGGYSASASFTPAANEHTANDCNGAAAEFTNVGPAGGQIRITGASLMILSDTAEATAWRLHLYNVTPPSAIADGGVYDLGAAGATQAADRAAYLGFVDLGTALDAGTTQWIEVSGIDKRVKLAGTSLFGYLINLTTMTPAAVAHIPTLYTEDV